MSTIKVPEYLDVQEDRIVITLARPFDVNGAKLTTITMREPTLKDQRLAAAIEGSDVEREVKIFANLTEVSTQDLDRLPLKSYVRLQRAYVLFLT